MIECSQKIILCSGWLNKPGIDRIYSSMLTSLEKGSEITIISNKRHTTESVKKLVLGNTRIKHYIIDDEKKYLHSKVYYFERSNIFSVIIGSANLTKGGLGKNEELSVLTTGQVGSKIQLEIMKYLARIIKA